MMLMIPQSISIARQSLRTISSPISRRSLHSSSSILSSLPTTPSPSSPNKVAEPHTPPHVAKEQAPNVPTTWSEGQRSRTEAMKGPRFEQMDMQTQPQPLSAMEMISREPIRLVPARKAECDGGGGPLGHPKVFINLDKPGAKACPYCGIRFEQDRSHHAGH